MDKWADYGISAVQYDSNDEHIEKLQVYPDEGDKLGKVNIYTRETVVAFIKANMTFTTITKGVSDKWNKGEDVSIVTVNEVEYLRTDRNSTAKDNLENLPRF